jgi:Fe-S-cluster containining protein
VEDLNRVRRGTIPLRDLFTICPGEPIHDNVKGNIRQAANDHIKIQPRKGSYSCRYYDAAQRVCTIYAQRPIQCRVLKCWDPTALEALYHQNHLTRKDLLGDIPGLWDLVDTHGRRCDARENARRAERLRARSEGWPKAEAQLLESLRYDQSLREIIHAQGRPDPALLPFLLGRPLLQRLAPLKLRLIHTAGRHRLAPL